MGQRHLFTSESVFPGHPDKVADQISDGVLDAFLSQDPKSRVACETLVSTGLVVLAGEVTSKAHVNLQEVVRGTIREIGYNDASMRFDADSCAVLVALGRQSADIARGVDESATHEMGAGDQGLMFGYACRQTEELMPLPIQISHRISQRADELRRNGTLKYLRPDGKCQVTVEYEGSQPVRIDTIVVSLQHDPSMNEKQDQLRSDVIRSIVKPILPEAFKSNDIVYHINPTGRFEIGGPHGDAGLTGRKIIVDTYGGYIPHGGGAFSGKDPTKVDRSAAYYSRYVAKNVVASGLAEECMIQVAYAIGVAQPVSILVESRGTGKVSDERLSEIVRESFDFRPKAIIEQLGLQAPIYRKTAANGHYGQAAFPWEKTDRASDLAKRIK